MAALTTLAFVAFFSCVWLIVRPSEGIEAKPGDNVTLQCQCPRGADIEMLRWIRPDLKSDGCVFYFRQNHIHEEGQHKSFHGRVVLKDPGMKDRNFSVILKNITINDTGTYECEVGYGGKPELINTINLTVDDSGDTAGHTEDGGNKNGRKQHEHFGLAASLTVFVVVVVVLLLVAAVVNLRKREGPTEQDSNTVIIPADGAGEQQV